ncbi:hypothetical protein JKF63_02926 [Porcisia hertigi]|uniref:Uncharacterized protein n=1 Tax=Porcisia hertigi TaxID=2761500 RepID=A0A836IMG5_9TRYP|nr:hypothetical protein JKF63_02926 [Porcisia hertigi]
MTSQERQAAMLALVRRLLLLDRTDASGYTLTNFAQLSDGAALYSTLRLIAPDVFPSTCTDPTDESVTVSFSTVSMPEVDAQRRERNMRVLLRGISAYTQEAMSTTSSRPVTQGLNPAVLAGSSGEPDEGSTSKEAVQQQQQQQLTHLAGVVVTLVVLSGVPAVLSEVKALSRQEQVVLSDWVKEIMRVHELKPSRRGGAGSGQGVSGSSAHLCPPNGSQTTSGSSVAASSLTTSGAAGGTFPSSQFFNGAHSRAAAAAAGEEDEGYYRNATYQLRHELAEVKAELTALQDAYRLSSEDKEIAEGKYQLLLHDQAKMSPAVTALAGVATTEGGASEVADGESSDILSVWQRRCAQKDETISALKARVEQQSTQVTALREAAAAHEMALQALRRRLKSAEEGIIVKSEERREAVQKLAVTEDKLAEQMKARMELETQVEELQSRVMVLTLDQDRLRGLGHDDVSQFNSSFVSNGSVDRVLALENELDDARQQRDNLQRQVGILQRQMAAMVVPVADVSTANDTWRAQLRQVEREREDLRQQLTTALGRLGDLQRQLTARAVTTATTALTTPRGGDAEQVEEASGAANAGDLISSIAEEGGVESRPLSTDADSLHDENVHLAPGSKTCEAMRREQVILSSLLLQYSYRNLLLQQHQTLLHKDAIEADMSRRRQAEEHLEMRRQAPSSVLTMQRRDVEQGLLETVLLGGRSRMMHEEN